MNRANAFDTRSQIASASVYPSVSAHTSVSEYASGASTGEYEREGKHASASVGERTHNALTHSAHDGNARIESVRALRVYADERARALRTPRAYGNAREKRAYGRRAKASKAERMPSLSFIGNGRGDSVLSIVAILLSLLGLLFIYSASCYSAKVQTGDAFHYVKTQAVALLLGVFSSVLLSNVKSSTLKKVSPLLYLVGLALLGMVFLPVLGIESYGAKRWLNLGFFTVQPSEYAKFFMVMAIARFASEADMKKFVNVLFVLFLGGAVCVLIMLEPNMSITMCVVAVVFAMLFASGARIKHLALLIVPVVLGAVALILVEPYRMQRLWAFLDPWQSPLEEGYQLIQSYYALGSGGLFGVGIGNGFLKQVAASESDLVFGLVSEEMGVIVAFTLAVAVGAMFIYARAITTRSRSTFYSISACCAAGLFVVQLSLNVFGATDVLPLTGVTFPFVSAGGSSIMSCWGLVAFIKAADERTYSVKR